MTSGLTREVYLTHPGQWESLSNHTNIVVSAMIGTVLLEMPSKHHALHILGLLANNDELRFSEIVKKTGHLDAEVGRGLNYLKEAHLVRSRTMEAGNRIVRAYSASIRGVAAWESFQAYGAAVEAREQILGRQEVQSFTRVLAS